MKYKRLFAELFVKDITKKDIAKLLGKSISAINSRFNGETSFTCNEVLKIMQEYFKDSSAEYIFSIGNQKIMECSK